MLLDVQFSAGAHDWPTLRELTLLAEARGFDTAWVFDHFTGSVLGGGTSMIECFTLLGAMAAATTTIRVGSLVVNVANRAPAVMAQSAAAVQAISAGRFTLGIGAGAAPGNGWSIEHRLLGIELAPTVATRHARLEAAFDELDRLWSPDRCAELDPIPVPRPQPPMIVGINSSASLAALSGRRADGINLRGDHPELATLIAAADEARAAAGRAGEPWDCSVWALWDDALLRGDHPERVRWVRLGVTRLVLVSLVPFDPRRLERAVIER